MNRFRIMGRFRRSWASPSLKHVGISDKRKLAARISGCVGLWGLFLFASCSNTPVASQAEVSRFSGGANADLIVQYNSDQVSHVLKPVTMEEGKYWSACDRPTVLKLAGEQPRRELAVIVLLSYFNEAQENQVKLAWMEDLKRLGYQNIVFLLTGPSMNHMSIEGLRILKSPHPEAAVARQ